MEATHVRSGPAVDESPVDDAAGTSPVCVYSVRMARVNVYLPDDLAEDARAAELNVSALTQEAIRGALARSETDRWLARVRRLPPIEVPRAAVEKAVADARAELGRTPDR